MTATADRKPEENAAPAHENDNDAPKSKLHAHARALAEAGIKVFPIEENGKRPLPGSNGFKDASADIAKVDVWWNANPNYNIGMCPEDAGWSVVDIDPGGESGWIEAMTANGGYEDTYEVRTPRGGRHIYFAGSLPSSASKLAPHVDTRGVGGYVLVPPSVVNGKPYEVVYDRPIVALPAWIAPVLAGKSSAVEGEDTFEDNDANVGRARTYLARLVEADDVAVSESGGNDRTFKLFVTIRDLGLSRAKAVDLVAEVWNPACRPPWSQHELTEISEHAYKYAQNAAGKDAVTGTAEEAFGKTDAFKEALAASKPANANDAPSDDEPQPIRFGELLKRRRPVLVELIPGLVQRSVMTLLAAPGAHHKSRLLLQWGLCLATNTPIWNGPEQRAKFVHLSYEDDADEITRRVQDIATTLKLQGDPGEYWDLRNRNRPLLTVKESAEVEWTPFGERMRKHLKGIDGHKFVGVDSCYNAVRFEGQAKINEGAVQSAINALDGMCTECNCTTLVLWHPSQAGQERGDASGWSVAWHNAPRARLSIERVDKKNPASDLILKPEKRNHSAPTKGIVLYYDGGAMKPRTDAQKAASADAFRDAVVKAATTAAKAKQPLQQKAHCPKKYVEEIAATIGRTPDQKEIKEALASAAADWLLYYHSSKTKNDPTGYYPAPSSARGEYPARILTLAKWFARWGRDDVSVTVLGMAHFILPTDPSDTPRDAMDNPRRLTPEEEQGMAGFRADFEAAVDAGVFGKAGIKPNKAQGQHDYGLRPVVLTNAQPGPAPATTGGVPDQTEGGL